MIDRQEKVGLRDVGSAASYMQIRFSACALATTY